MSHRFATIVYSQDLEPRMWSERHVKGEVPGHYPYGLDRIAHAGLRIETELVRPARRRPRDWTGLLNPRCWLPRRQERTGPAMLAWDESTAVPMFVRHAHSDRRLMAGMIWATDLVAAPGYSPRLSVLRQVYRRMDAVWALSGAQLPVLRDWLGIPADRIHFVPFGIDTNFFPAAPFPERPMVLSLGNDRDRDPATLFEAMRMVRSRLPHTRFVVQSQSGLPVPPGVEVIPRLTGPQVRELYAQATVVAVATRPNVHVSGMTTALEAMSTGRPVVLSATDGAADYVRDGNTGLLVPPGDPQAMADAVHGLLSQGDLLRDMGSAASAHVRASHSEDTMAAVLAGIARG
jgi:glycosyltransferase involved in cell wall biosynthesis